MAVIVIPAGLAGHTCFSKKRSSMAALETFEIPEEPRFPYEFLPPFPRAKLTSETFNCGLSAFIFLMKVEYNSTVAAKSS
jgi:hypothetical protein